MANFFKEEVEHIGERLEKAIGSHSPISILLVRWVFFPML